MQECTHVCKCERRERMSVRRPLMTRSIINLPRGNHLEEEPKFVQGSAKRWSPGCVNAAGKAGSSGKQQQE